MGEGWAHLVIIKIALAVAFNRAFLMQHAKFQMPHFKKISIPVLHPEKPVLAEVLLNLKKDSDMLKQLGEPLKAGRVLRLRHNNPDNIKEVFDVEFEVSGSLKKASIFVEAEVDTGVVMLKQLVVYFQNPPKKVWQIPRHRDSEPVAA